jgi:hypothetical protein
VKSASKRSMNPAAILLRCNGGLVITSSSVIRLSKA